MTRTRKKRSVIWITPKEKFEEIVSNSCTLADILRSLSLTPEAGNYKTLKARLKTETINVTHLAIGRLDANRGRRFNREKLPLSEVLVEHSTYTRKTLKNRLLNEGLLRNECYKCGQLPMWDGTNLVLVLDHINGESDDNRIENLRMLCPNCNSQTSTFCGKNKKKVFFLQSFGE